MTNSDTKPALAVLAMLCLLTVLPACGKGQTGEDPTSCSVCPTQEQPYLNLWCQACVDLTQEPIIRNVNINPPGGGKVPLNAEFCAEVEFQYPELESGSTVIWDVDGLPGPDIEANHDVCVNYLYDDCQDTVIPVTLTPRDRFNRRGLTIERSLQVNCNLAPQVACTVFGQAINEPPDITPGQTIIFFAVGQDLDNFDPALESSEGIARFEIDYEGDGVFDFSLPGNRQELPINQVYSVAGAYRPVVRAYDSDGDYGVATCDLVTVFPLTQPGLTLWLSGATRAILALDDLPAAFPVTSAIVGTDRMGVSFLRQDANDQALVLAENVQVESGEGGFDTVRHAPSDFARLGNAVFVADADNQRGLEVYQLGANSAIDPTELRRSECAADLGMLPDRVEATKFVSDVASARLVIGNPFGAASADRLRVIDADDILGGFDQSLGCDDYLFEHGAGLLSLTAFGFGMSFGFTDYALAETYAFVGVNEGDQYGVAAYDLAETEHSVYCSGGAAGCLYLDDPVVAVAALPQQVFAQFLGQQLGAGAVTTYSLYALHRPALTAATARLWLGGVAYAPGAGTWWFTGDTTVAVSANLTTLPMFAAAATFAMVSPPLLAVADQAQQLRIYKLGLSGAPTYTTLATFAWPVTIDSLELYAGHVAVLNRSEPFQTVPSAYADRQRRGLYLAPITAPEKIVQVLPYRQALRNVANYNGFAAVSGSKNDILWVADRENGLFKLNTRDFYTGVYAAAPTVATSVVDPASDVGLGGAIQSVRIPDRERRAIVTLGAGGTALVDFDLSFACSTGTCPLPRLQQMRLSSETVLSADVLHHASLAGDFIASASGSGAEIFAANDFGRTLATYEPPSGYSIAHVEMVLDPAPENFAIFYTYENRPSGKTGANLQGLNSAGQLSPARQFRITEDFVSAQNESLGFDPPVFARLDADPNATRSMDYFANSGAKICIEPFWGQLCPIDSDSGAIVELFPSLINGDPLRALVQGVPFIIRPNPNNSAFTIFDRDGIFVHQAAESICASLPEAEQFDCAIFRQFVSAASADPFFLYANRYALIFIDMRNPTLPRVVARQQSGANSPQDNIFLSGRLFTDVAGWLDNIDLISVYHCDDSSTVCNDNQRLLTTKIVGIGDADE